MRSFKPLSNNKPRQGMVGAYTTSPYAPLAIGSLPLEREDEVLRNKGYGRGAELYSKLLNDPSVSEGFEKFTTEIIQREWNIIAPTSELEDFLTNQLLNLGANTHSAKGSEQKLGSGCSFNELCKGLLEAYITGMEVAEIQWQPTRSGIKAKAVSLRESRRLRLIPKDDYLMPTILQDLGDTCGIPVKPRSLIIHRFWASHHYEPHGYGIGRQLYYLTEFRRAAMVNWLAFADRFTVPTALAEYEIGVPEEELDALEDGLRGLGRETQAMIPKGVSLSWLKAEGDWEIYLKIINYCDDMISMLLNSQATVGSVTTGGGSRARDQVADSLSIRKAKAHADLLADTLNDTLIKWLVELNYADADNLDFMPYIKWSFPELEQKRGWSDTLDLIERLTNLGYELDEDWLRDYLEVPLQKQQTSASLGQTPAADILNQINSGEINVDEN
jgi:phage gp29-like protein